jgi:hypothetical protein
MKTKGRQLKWFTKATPYPIGFITRLLSMQRRNNGIYIIVKSERKF